MVRHPRPRIPKSRRSTASSSLICLWRRRLAFGICALSEGMDRRPQAHVSADLCCRLSYVPLIAPATSDHRMRLLCKLADSFIYVVSRMGVTGATGTLNADLPKLLARVKQY